MNGIRQTKWNSRKVLNVDKMKSLGWEPKIGLKGIESTYAWYKENADV